MLFSFVFSFFDLTQGHKFKIPKNNVGGSLPDFLFLLYVATIFLKVATISSLLVALRFFYILSPVVINYQTYRCGE